MAQLFLSNGLQYRIIWHSYFCPMDYSKESYGTAISAQWITAKRQVAQLLLLSGLQYTITWHSCFCRKSKDSYGTTVVVH
jgi:hypothetical protein